MRKHLALIGFPGSGKSSVGKKVAFLTSRPFVETDHWVEDAYGRFGLRCRDIFFTEGEAFFRALEHSVLEKLLSLNTSIVATGGGTPLQPDNQSVLKKSCNLLYLKVEPNLLKRRLLSQKTLPAYLDPLYPEKSFDLLYAKRAPLYQACADYTLDVRGASIQECVEQVLQILAGF